MFRIFIFFSIFFSFIGCSGSKNSPKLKLALDPSTFVLNMQTARMKGCLDEIVQTLEKNIGIVIEQVHASQDSLEDLLEGGQVDMMFSDLSAFMIQKEKYRFSENLIYNGVYLVTQKDDRRNLENLDSRRVLVMNNEEASFLIAKYPKVDFGFYKEDTDAFIQLSKSVCSAILVPVVYFRMFEAEYRVDPHEVTDRHFRFLSTKTNRNVDVALKEIAKMRKNGTLNDIIVKWGIIPSP